MLCVRVGSRGGRRLLLEVRTAVIHRNISRGIRENIAALLAYVLFWITGIIFYLIDKRSFVRFHALQSIIAFGGLMFLRWVLFWAGIGGLGWTVTGLLRGIISAAIFICWIVCMVKAYQGHRFKLPLAGDLAEKYAS